MTENYDALFYEDIPKKNKTIQGMMLCSLIGPVVFIMGKVVNLWDIDIYYSVVLFVYIFCCTVISILLNGKEKTQKFCMYFTLISSCGIIFAIQANHLVNPTLTIGIVPIISCLFFNTRLALCISIVNFVLVSIATFLRFGNLFLGYMIGLLMEFSFLTFCINWLIRIFQKEYVDKNLLIEKAEQLQANLEEKNLYLQNSQYKIIQFTGKALGQNDFYTSRHVVHTQEYVELICKQLSREGFYKNILTEEEIKIFSSAAYLHDIGKLHIDSKVLERKNNFSNDEIELIKTHAEKGATLLELLPKIDDGHFNDVAVQMAMSHHEHWDGSGYPNGLKNTTIPLCARILAVADALDNYIEENATTDSAVLDALKKLDEQSDKYFERCIVDVTIRLRFDIERLVKQFDMQENSPSYEDMVWWALNHKF